MSDRARRWHMPLAGAWGFAEATLFFVIPDVLLGWIALRDGRRAAIATGVAILGALAGAALLLAAPSFFAPLVARVPGIPDAMVARAAQQVAQQGVWAMILGPLGGIPFKVYAIELARAGTPAWLILLAAIPARLGRFALVAALCALIGRALRGFIAKRPRATIAIYVGVWAIEYAVYFALVAREYGGL